MAKQKVFKDKYGTKLESLEGEGRGCGHLLGVVWITVKVGK